MNTPDQGIHLGSQIFNISVKVNLLSDIITRPNPIHDKFKHVNEAEISRLLGRVDVELQALIDQFRKAAGTPEFRQEDLGSTEGEPSKG